MISSGALGGVPSENVQFLTTSGSIYVPNEPSTLAVKKLWYSEDGAETTPGAEEVKIDLIQQAVKSNAIAVTIISKSKLEYLDNLVERGCAPDTIATYRRSLMKLYTGEIYGEDCERLCFGRKWIPRVPRRAQLADHKAAAAA